MEDNRTLYEKSVQDRSTLRYYLGLIVRWKQNWKYVRARRIARKRGATIGEGVLMPISLAKKVNKNVKIGDHTILQTDNFSSFRHPITIGSHVIIGYGAVVGANAVVVKDVESMSVVGGNPAKHIRYRKCVHSAIVVESLIGGDYKIYKETRRKRKR